MVPYSASKSLQHSLYRRCGAARLLQWRRGTFLRHIFLALYLSSHQPLAAPLAPQSPLCMRISRCDCLGWVRQGPACIPRYSLKMNIDGALRLFRNGSKGQIQMRGTIRGAGKMSFVMALCLVAHSATEGLLS